MPFIIIIFIVIILKEIKMDESTHKQMSVTVTVTDSVNPASRLPSKEKIESDLETLK
jgi:hypothetical protein